MDKSYVPAAGVGSTSLGRLELRVPGRTGPETVLKERRWPDAPAARSWCEHTVSTAPAGSVVIEIQVFEESWRHATSWERVDRRPVAETLQLGVADATGTVRWGEPRSMTPQLADRLPL